MRHTSNYWSFRSTRWFNTYST